MRREDIAAAVLASMEAKTVLIEGLYQTLLGRNPTPGEITAFLTTVQAGARDEQTVASIVGSQEYFDKTP